MQLTWVSRHVRVLNYQSYRRCFAPYSGRTLRHVPSSRSSPSSPPDLLVQWATTRTVMCTIRYDSDHWSIFYGSYLIPCRCFGHSIVVIHSPGLAVHSGPPRAGDEGIALDSSAHPVDLSRLVSNVQSSPHGQHMRQYCISTCQQFPGLLVTEGSIETCLLYFYALIIMGFIEPMQVTVTKCQLRYTVQFVERAYI